MIEFIPYIIEMMVPLAVGVLALFLYRTHQKRGLPLVAAGFFLSAIPAVVRLALGGPYWALWLRDQGYTTYQMGMIQLYLWIFGAASQAVFAILVVAGLIQLSRNL
jgi:hypothetical protein